MAGLRIEQIAAGAFAALVVLSLPTMAQQAPAAAPIIDKPFAEHHVAAAFPKDPGAAVGRRMHA